MYNLNIYTSPYLIETFTVRYLFSLGTDTGKQMITFFDTYNYNSLTYTNYICGYVLRCCAVLSLRHDAIDLIRYSTREILIGESFLKPFGTIRDRTLNGRNSCLLTPTRKGRTEVG